MTPEERRRLVPTFPTLRTERLALREITDAEAPWYLAHFSRPEIVRGTGFPAPDGLAGARDELERYITGLFARRQGIRWGLVPDGETDPVGTAGIYRWVDEPLRQAELGYDLAREWWGRGLMTEALRAIVDYAATRLRLEWIEAIVLTDNTRSCAALERVGFAREAVLPAHGEDEHGVLRDEFRYVLHLPGAR
jgi:ribosomal-protein-alanine N-acetyltransferase